MTVSRLRSGLIKTFSLFSVVILVTLLVFGLDDPASVQAGGTVATCNEASLLTALNGGGTVTFTCDGTITLSATISISANTTLDATGHTVTLSGNNALRILSLNSGITLTLQNVNFSNGNQSSGVGGAILNNGGTLNINGGTFSTNRASAYSDTLGTGGAIFNNATSILNITNTTFSSNTGAGGGGAISNSGLAVINNASFFLNVSGDGAALYNDLTGTLTLNNSTFISNGTNNYMAGWGRAGGILNIGGKLTLTSCTFSDNNAGFGGAIYNESSNQNSATLNISNSTFTHNISTSNSSGGGAIQAGNGIVNINNSSFTNNGSYGGGGAILHSYGNMSITNSTFANNISNGGSGGAILSFSEPDSIYFFVPVSVNIVNSTFSGNSAFFQGGAISLFGKALIVNSTLSGNSAAQQGGAIFQISQQGTLTTLKNTIIANSPNGGNCAGVAVTDGGNNLQFPGTTCGATIPTADPLLQALQNNGGPTQTLALTAGSPAIDAGNNQVCAAPPLYNMDQRGAFRPAGTNCDIGAYEANGVIPGTLVVTNTTDNVNSPSAGSLRQIVAQAAALGGAIVTFSPSLGTNPQITLAGALIVPSKVWIEASCTNKVSLLANFSNAFQLSGNGVIQGIVVINSGGTSSKFTGHGTRITCSQARKIP